MMARGQVQLLVAILVAMLELQTACSVPVQARLSFINPPRRLLTHEKRPASDDVAVVVISSAGHVSVPPSPPMEQKLDGGVKGAGNPAMQDMDVASRKPTPVGGSFHVDYNSPARHPPKNN